MYTSRAIRYSARTTFEGGTGASLANDVEVEALGVVDSEGVRRASRIEIEQGD